VKNIRRIVISNIVATDMFLHKTEVKKFSEMTASPDFNPKKQETKEYIMTHMLHFSDISNPTKTFEVYDIWVKKIFIEFFQQVNVSFIFREIRKKSLDFQFPSIVTGTQSRSQDHRYFS
jgi:hypothetical protein